MESVLNGYNATAFAYGQSGTGKTYTMTGGPTPSTAGIIPNALSHFFESIQQEEKNSDSHKTFSIRVSYVEIYNGKCRDLLTDESENLEIKENEHKIFYVQGLQAVKVISPEQCIKLLEEGANRREVGATQLNQDSSRSHSVFTVELTSVTHEDENPVIVTSKFNMVDLAGSERVSKTAAEGGRFKEGCGINLSLTSLGSVIDALVRAKGHVPFRSSPLTMLLKDSLGGNCRTVMFATCSPVEWNAQETLSTLRFADRAKRIKNKPRVQLEPKDELIVQLREEITLLKQKLRAAGVDEEADLEHNDELERLKIEIVGMKTEIQNLNTDVARVEGLRIAAEKELQEQSDDLSMLKEAASTGSRLLLGLSKGIFDFVLTALPNETQRNEWCADLSSEAGGASLAIGTSDALSLAGSVAGFNRVLSQMGREGQVHIPVSRSPDSTGLTPSPQNSIGSGSDSNENASNIATVASPVDMRAIASPTFQGAPQPPKKKREKKDKNVALDSNEQLAAAQNVALERLKKQVISKTEHVDTLKQQLHDAKETLRRGEMGFQLQIDKTEIRLVEKHNRILEEVIATHKGEVCKMKKSSADAKKRLRKVKEAQEALEVRLDEKLVQYDTLYRDFEELKLQSMKQLKSPAEVQKPFPVNPNTVKLSSLASAASKFTLPSRDPSGDLSGAQHNGVPVDRMCSRSAPLAHGHAREVW